MSAFIENKDIIEVGENIRKRREALGISQNELALQVDTSLNAIHLYENANRIMRLDRWFLIADALKTTPSRIGPTRYCSKENVDPRLLNLMERSKKLPPEKRDELFRNMEYLLNGMLCTMEQAAV